MAPSNSNEQTNKAVSPAKSIISGGISGGLEILITFPTEYVKTQLQLSKTNFTGPLNCVSRTIKEKGPLGLYRGLSPLLYFSIPKAAVRFTSFEQFKRLFQQGQNRPLTNLEATMAGFGAGVMEAILTVTPMENVKVKFIHDQVLSEKPRYRGFFHGMSVILKENGIAGIYKGLMPTILKQSTNQAIRFFVYNFITTKLKGEEKNRRLTWYETFFSGVVAGAASVFGNTPIDVVKTRMQGLESHKYKNSIDCATKIWQQEGFLAFYKGTTPRLGRVCLDVGLVFMFYEQINRMLNKVW
eukprot:TRINITY_DN7898_c0_g1_i1.p1 TRINITY_DN7898_c0_g1~~TRINITY_DN7898_c0_g1_i1.p1  ORF type:complete len:298 (-),score=53.94 TRINITY_DN7898_c0_g1_i1:40-933(-)